MRVLGILLIFFVLWTNSQSSRLEIGRSKGGFLGFGGSLKPTVDSILCRVKTITDNTADQVQSACADLPGNIVAVVKEAKITCKTTTRGLKSLSNKLAKYCQDSTINLPTTTTTTDTPTTTTTTDLPTTTTTTDPPTTTTTTERPKTCEELYPGYIERCNEICLKDSRYIYLGGECKLFEFNGVSCFCTRVTKCENYQNTTCQNKCRKKTANDGYCRVPERNIPCACRIHIKYDNSSNYEYPEEIRYEKDADNHK
ncbi:integumentary mucin C.1-like isoform X2 [Argiope bruennichi]|uniref:integumentary mucin C.1-like isoform X2 n=1 Tax=Argiope bruennichi TaxID=94029 RepID=UPI002495850A|nr:integumentary mucin C.1-like isoform X2 [Argiope bruennichi]